MVCDLHSDHMLYLFKLTVEESNIQDQDFSEKTNNPFYVINENVNIIDCTFEDNKNSFSGGAVFIVGTSEINVTLQSSSFSDNYSPFGGAISISLATKSYLNIQSCNFSNNLADYGLHFAITSDQTVISLSRFMHSPSLNLTEKDLLGSLENSGEELENINHSIDFSVFNSLHGVLNVENTYFANCGFYHEDTNDAVFFTSKSTGNVTNSCFNMMTLDSFVISDQAIVEGQKNISCASCRLITTLPFPTPTRNVSASDTTSIVCIISIIFFVLVSIIGIFVVKCGACAYEAEGTQLEDADPLEEQLNISKPPTKKTK